MSTLVVTVDADTPIVMSATRGATDLGITAYQEPAILAATFYAPDSPLVHGSVALAWRYQQTLINFTVAPFGATSEAEAKTLIASLRAAVSGLGYETTTNPNGVPEVWLCDAGSVTPANARSRLDLDRPWITEWNVSIPCYPVSG